MEDLHTSKISARTESPKKVRRHKSGRVIKEAYSWPSDKFWFTDFTAKYLEK